MTRIKHRRYTVLAVFLGVATFTLTACESESILSDGNHSNQPPITAPPGGGGPGGGGGGGGEPANYSHAISFSILEDYDKDDPVSELEADFALFNELGIDTWRGSFGWDDYEPTQDAFDVDWLHTFANTAATYGINLRPYLGYTAPWAAQGGSDGQYWNDPPADVADWVDFAGTIASEMSQHSNVLSYEIYNEENDAFWWEGTMAEYDSVLAMGSDVIRANHSGAEVIIGGFVFPEFEWIDGPCNTFGHGSKFDIAPFHAYPETWSGNNVKVENYLDSQYHDWYVPTVKNDCGGQPIWINEIGFAAPWDGTTEQDQAEWWVRAFATYIADPHIEHLGIYEIKDLTGDDVIGGEANFHLGLTYADRSKKIAFYTVAMLVDLFDVGTITMAPSEISSVNVVGRKSKDYYEHLFKRPDNAQIIIAYDKNRDVTVDLTITDSGSSVTEYALDGTATVYSGFDGTTLSGVALSDGVPRIFLVNP